MKDLLSARDRSKTVAITNTLILEQNDRRLWAVFVNQGANNVNLRLGEPAVLGEGIHLRASGGSFSMDMKTFPWYGEVYGIADTVASAVTCQEVMEKV